MGTSNPEDHGPTQAWVPIPPGAITSPRLPGGSVGRGRPEEPSEQRAHQDQQPIQRGGVREVVVAEELGSHGSLYPGRPSKLKIGPARGPAVTFLEILEVGLFHRHRLGQIARLIYVAAAQDRNVVG